MQKTPPQKNKAARSSKARPDSIHSVQRKGSNGSTKKPGGDGASGNVGFHLLGSVLRPITQLEVLLQKGESCNGLLKIVDTEEKQLQAIEDLYAIVKAQPRYANLKEPDWKPTTSPVTILQWLLRKLGPLAQGNQWTIDTYQARGRTRFRFVVYTNYNRQDLKERSEYYPLDFLPHLEKRDKALHDLIIDTVALVSKYNKVPLWDEDGDYSHFLKEVPRMNYSRNNTLDEQLFSYSQGPAYQYLQLIKKRRREVTPASVSKLISKYPAKSQRQRQLAWWARMGERLASEGVSIEKFSYVPNHIPGNAVGPFRLYKFVWSIHEADWLHSNAKGRIDKDENDFGTRIPVMFSVAKPGEQFSESTFDRFPVRLYHFMREGIAMVYWRYEQYFYKDKLKLPCTPTNTLLQSLELQEIQQLRYGQRNNQ